MYNTPHQPAELSANERPLIEANAFPHPMVAIQPLSLY
jgi:hypothetical protein